MSGHRLAVDDRALLAPSALPSVSVVIPAYNAARLLPQTLQCVLAQSMQPIEIIVVDDGSTDTTASVARSLGARVISVSNAGPSNARNVGTLAASGEYVAYLDADDLWPPEKLSAQVAALAAYSGPAFSFTDYRPFDDRGLYRSSGEIKRRRSFHAVAQRADAGADIFVMTASSERPVLTESFILPSTVLVRRSDALAVGGFDVTLRAAEDYDFFLRLIKRVPAVVVLKPLALYRQHAAQATANTTSMRSALSEVASRVAAAPHRYPSGDVRYLERTAYLRQFTLGIQLARLGEFDEAAASFARSLAARRTARAYLGWYAARLCSSTAGRTAFTTIRNAWKRRPKRRYGMPPAPTAIRHSYWAQRNASHNSAS